MHRYYGDLTIRIQNSLSVRIPNTELVVPDTYIAPNGQIRTNDSASNIVINSLQTYNNDDLPVLGRLFMSSAYLMVNYEAHLFSIWQANTGSKIPELIALDEKNNLISDFCSGRSNVSSVGPNDGSSGPPSSPEEAEKPKTLTGGAIGGIVAGAVAAVIGILLLGYYLYRRKKKTDDEGLMQEESELKLPGDFKPVYGDAHSTLQGNVPSELPADRQYIVELTG